MWIERCQLVNNHWPMVTQKCARAFGAVALRSALSPVDSLLNVDYSLVTAALRASVTALQLTYAT
jgi:hypothetical protein